MATATCALAALLLFEAITTSAKTDRRTRQDSESRACPKSTSKVHVVGLVQRSVNKTINSEENNSMFRRGEVWSRQENATPQQAQRQSGTRPTWRKTKGRTKDYTTGKVRKYMASKHQTTTRKSAYSWAPPKPKSRVTKHKASRAKYRRNLSSACPCLFIPHDTYLAHRANRNEWHHEAERTRNMTRHQQNNKPLSNTRQRDMRQHYVSRTHHDTTSNHATLHDNTKNRVPRHNTHPNAAQHDSKQHNTTQHNTATGAPPQHNGRATPYHTSNHNTTALHDTIMEHNQHTYYTTPRNAETQLKTTSPPTRYTNPKQTTKQQYTITQNATQYNQPPSENTQHRVTIPNATHQHTTQRTTTRHDTTTHVTARHNTGTIRHHGRTQQHIM